MGEEKVFISIRDLFPRLYQYVPGWIRGSYHCISAVTGIGKTKFAKWAFVLWSYKYCRANGIPFKCIYFALEESKEKFWSTVTSELLYERYGIALSYYQLEGYYGILSDDLLEKIKSVQPEVEEMKKAIIVDDDTANPTGILKRVKSVIAGLGNFYIAEEYDTETNITIKVEKIKYNNPDQHVMVVIDNYNLLTPEPGNKLEPIPDLFGAISKMSEYFVRKICKHYQCIGVAVQQQTMTADNIDHRKFGLLKPSHSNLGDNKVVGRDYQYFWGLWSPYKYDIKDYGGYNLTKLKKRLTMLWVEKHRDGDNMVELPLLFHGVTSKYEELPLPTVKDAAGKDIVNPELITIYNNLNV